MPETARIVAGECTTEFSGARHRDRQGQVVVLIKPDDTVLVHDMDGYQPVAWLTRPESLSTDGGAITARDGDHSLRVTIHETVLDGHYPVSTAGEPVSPCPRCGSVLVHSQAAISCIGCGDRYGLPGGATLGEASCESCGLPLMEVDRGARFEICVDRQCDPLDDRVRERFDREWSCPDCEGDLRILRRGGLIAGCDRYPDCSTGFAIPDGLVTGQCGCGLPTLETEGGDRCLDAACGAAA